VTTPALREAAQAIVLDPDNRGQDHPVAGRDVRQVERYYLARVQPENMLPQSAASPDSIREWRWWTLAEIAASSQAVSLPNLPKWSGTSWPPARRQHR
jgi:hypothetical protein